MPSSLPVIRRKKRAHQDLHEGAQGKIPLEEGRTGIIQKDDGHRQAQNEGLPPMAAPPGFNGKAQEVAPGKEGEYQQKVRGDH